MALLPDVFVPEDAEDNPFAPIDAGWYEAEITKSELKTTNDKEGKYVALTFKVTEGEHLGRMLFANLNIVNKSDVAVKIARSDLKKICIAAGMDPEAGLEDTVDLHNVPMKVLVSLKPANANWPAKNELKDFKDASFDPEDETLTE